ncbi:spermidine/putrescine ABC transporter substrate-binding protein [Rhodovulum sulfidophilum]|uniref:Extracellular solute-binding protein n=1 Tax=Rhodovulum visakhapatnamense TaxID=364297 RepID=A0ABS1RCD7_9RHOB|nr:extracellular solute-binding protein [Rhodovulum visakhapatnamense]MBL3569330.1 extracellular solute-binding protein [Rhodovulum visakhapatnamense]MBL3577300.1 extracellular solute-binding protein [Rhodovulum visakhapatnamense]OLS45805.1 spermidine/putrescine ABC transporter substrate-binding protein [Rhodovulum sulfidophilum]
MKSTVPSLSRRAVLATGAAALAAPLIARRALASSGEVNVFAWGDYFQNGEIPAAFTDATGIKVNVSTYGSNEEAASKLRAAGGKGFDILFPSIDTRPNYDEGGLLAEIDESRLKVERIQPALWRSSLELGAAHRGKRYLVPFDWGTEGITWDSSALDIAPGELSYGHLWADGLAGKVAMRQKSVLTSLAIYLDAIGELPSNRGMDVYKTEADNRRIFDACIEFVKAHKSNIGAFWNNATEATSAFTDGGCTIGQTWDTTGIKLHTDTDPKWRYGAPKEGALAWMDTAAIPSGAENVEQAYEFLNFLLTPEVGGMFANATGYNSAAMGAAEHLSDANKEAFAYAYPGDAIDNLWWWPMFTPWFSAVREEYVEKLTNA